MGTDINATTAVLVDIEEIEGFFESAKLARAFAGYLLIHQRDWVRDLTTNGRILVQDPEKDGDEQEDRGDIYERLEGIQTGRDLFHLYRDICFGNQAGSVGKYDETYFENEDGLLELLNMYLRAWKHFSGSKMPLADAILTFGSGRNCDWAVAKYGHPYISFSEDAVFERRLTAEGADLQAALGFEISTTTYTSVSY